MRKTAPQPIVPRPYFEPPSVDREKLPASVRAALESILDLAYFELVLCPNNALERAAGTSVVFILFLEILDQCELGELITKSLAGKLKDTAARDKAFAKHLRLVSVKQSAIDALVRVRKLSIKMWTIPDVTRSA